MTQLYVTLLGVLNRLRSDDEGATAVEYGLMVALIAVVIIGTVTLLGEQLDAVFQSVVDALPGGAAPAP